MYDVSQETLGRLEPQTETRARTIYSSLLNASAKLFKNRFADWVKGSIALHRITLIAKPESISVK